MLFTAAILIEIGEKMENKQKIKINTLPAPTWRHLKMNFAEIQAVEFQCFAVPSMDVPDGVKTAVVKSTADVATGCGEGLSRMLNGDSLQIEVSGKVEQPLRLNYCFEEGKIVESRIEIAAAPYAEATAIAFYESDAAATGFGAVQTVVKAAEGTKIHLVQVVNVGSNFEFINDVGIVEADSARVEVTQIYLGGGSVYGGIRSDLAGYQSEFKNDIGYMLKNDENLDINIIASHSGKKSSCEITAKGVLSDTSSKVFRGTIDFLHGASGAKGAENEEVLLMSEKVVNKTIPLILCAEEDVEGSHGASVGRIDENFIFYMMSRGLSVERIYQIMANAKILSIMRNIDDDDTKARIIEMLGGDEDAESSIAR